MAGRAKKPKAPPGSDLAAIDDYIKAFDKDTQERLNAIRAIFDELMPEAIKDYAWQMPRYRVGKQPIFFAGFKNHVSLFTDKVQVMGERLEGYKVSKGTVQFTSKKPLPLDLIRKIVETFLELNR
jgi:uncharacterized protein YdhG (YjbR/CyaY superfamily)